MLQQRERWNNRVAFVLAAIGSAAGLGNAWRFPYICYKNGGGAFLIPYFVCLLAIGIPLLVLEFSFGQKYQKGAPGAFAAIKEKFEGFGWWAVLSGFIITTYYAVIMAWVWVYLKDSFTIKSWGANSGEHFFNNVLKISESPGILGGFSTPVLVGLILTWVSIYLILYKGVGIVSKVVWFTVPLPVICMGILAIRALTLPGALEGINYYLTPDFSVLTNGQVWLDAMGQIFFTLSLGFGIMIAYASYMPEDSDITNNALITVFANSGISFLAGFAIFGTLGYMAQAQGVPIEEVVAGGVGLAFVVYPKAISLLPFGATLFSLVFFLMLLTLGIDSAFSIVEAGVAAIQDKWGVSKKKAVLLMCTLSFLVGLFFATKASLYWLDIVDHFVNAFGLTIAGFVEAIVIGYIVKAHVIRDYFNPISEYKFGSWWEIMVKVIAPVSLFILIVNQLISEFKEPYGGYGTNYLLLGGLGTIVILLIGSVILSRWKTTAVEVEKGGLVQ